MSILRVCFPVFVAAGVCAGLAGCSSEASEAPPSTDDLASLESELAIAQGSLGGALDEAKACFQDFKDCRAAGTGRADCAEALKACLPAPANLPAPPAGAAGASGAPGFFGFGAGLLPMPGAGPVGSGFAGLPAPGAGPAGAGFAGAAGVDPAALEACKDGISGAASGGSGDPAALGAAFKACLGDAFTDLFADICERVATACDGAAAADVCDRLTDACTDAALSP